MNSIVNKYFISIIIPFFNSEKFIYNCINSINKQTFKKKIEVIFINDCSKDNSLKILEKYQKKYFKIFSLKKNLGPAAARNVGIQKAKGEYIFFLDIDDLISKNTLSVLYDVAKKKNLDLIFSDRKWLENSNNLRKNKYAFPKNKFFDQLEIKKEMEERYYDPLRAVGLFQLTGRLIKRKIIIKNKILFEPSLRYLEDEAFEWDVLGNISSAAYIKKQLYSYNINPNISSGLVEGIVKNFKVKSFKIVIHHIKKSLIKKNFTKKKISEITSQAYIYLIISSLISLSRSILLKKIDHRVGEKKRFNLIKKIINDKKTEKALEYYVSSDKESYWIPKLIKWKLPNLLKIFCILRAKKILKIRRDSNN